MGPSTLATYDWVGSLTPLHATSSGKVLLAALTADEGHHPQDSGLPARTPRTVTNRAELEKQLLEISRKGYAHVHEEFEIGLTAVAVPIWNHAGT